MAINSLKNIFSLLVKNGRKSRKKFFQVDNVIRKSIHFFS